MAKLFSVLNIPPLNRNTLKRMERAAGKCIEEVAEESCVAAIEEETSKTQSRFLYFLHVLWLNPFWFTIFDPF